ncbi:flavin-containing monooxygenase FMO GS-OX4 isoform X2 [Capsella rubella]|uniref:flavin-containing monooxygenase FMO GS-OX4 isoform X2 n=1 Tax=Capsella rubella TaxID=81985 RepID=UPI000CD4A485|nr:flavin-containing monooxygenase FMO GS-OX4 isoform X2 [Capsella rubella]
MAPAPSPINSQHVAVIGAGAAGLVAARELRREGHTVVVLDREKQVGGLWVYTPKVESDPLGLDPTRPIVHSSVYESLRTNLPRECMGYQDYPFVPRNDDPSRDSRRYPSHREVLAYLQDFATEFNIEEMIRFETEVVRVEPVNGKWRVQSKTAGGLSNDEIFDAVVVCCGHFTEPNIAQIPGIESWPGRQTHSHSYRVPDPFKDEDTILSRLLLNLFLPIELNPTKERALNLSLLHPCSPKRKQTLTFSAFCFASFEVYNHVQRV